jgi:RluA family pseudouridine synthase
MNVIKLSAPATRGFWEIPVLFEDGHLLALDKPAGLPVSPDRQDLQQPNLVQLLHAGVAAAKPWATARGLSYLSPVHRLDAETTGLLVFAKSKAVLVALANWFGSQPAGISFIALVAGVPAAAEFEVNAKIAPHPLRPDEMVIDSKRGKKSRTQFKVVEGFSRHAAVECRPSVGRPHQIRVHLKYAGHPLVGDGAYGGKPLWLSRLKPDFRLKPGREERPLLARAALHAQRLELPHPVTQRPLVITAPVPKDLRVALRYLREFTGGAPAPTPAD